MDWTKLTDQVSKIKVKNVADMPLFYALWIFSLAIISSIWSKHAWIPVALFFLGGFLTLVAGFGYFYFLFKNPDYLRSEEYHLRKQSLEILGDKNNLLPVDAKNIVEITNPHPSVLEGGEINKDENNV